ncbi:MAG: DUF262 domain-containing protein [Eubacteriales bacterium]|nr:DUF262 domain-containing protein [Eubacteriales bacterium]
MKIELNQITVRDVVSGYVDNQENGVLGYSGKLDIRPAYQREFVYDEKKRNAVIETIQKDFPLNVMYWVKNEDGSFEVLDGQQRTISFCQYINGDFSLNDKYFHNLTEPEKEQILNYKLFVYFCEGNDKEKLDWFQIINIAGERLSDQELRNAVYTGPWLTNAKSYFSKTNCAAYLLGKDYVTGSPIRQEYLETVLSWINDGKIEAYMAEHQHDTHATPLWQYFQSIINWVQLIFPVYHKEMKGLNWGALYKKFGSNSYDPKVVGGMVDKLYGDLYVKNKKGVFEYILGGCVDTKLLEIRIFEDSVKRAKYAEQTQRATVQGKSNCPLCAVGENANKNRIYNIEEMDADHVSAWSKGGASDITNCEMLCITHNRAKGNK